MDNLYKIRKGKVIVFNGKPHAVMSVSRQDGFVQTILRNIETDALVEARIKSADSVEFCKTRMLEVDLCYVDGDTYHFKDVETYEDFPVRQKVIGDDVKWILEGQSYALVFFNEKIAAIELPVMMDIRVADVPESNGIGRTKSVMLENGVMIEVPANIQAGNKISVGTENGTFEMTARY